MGKHYLKKLGKMIEYILLHRPDEFGLFLNDDGSLPIKELLWALNEETGWKHVRSGHLKELSYCGLQLTFVVEESLIRPKRAYRQTAPMGVPPRLLYFAAKRKTYPAILKHGLKPGGRTYVPLATTEEMALRIGKRRDLNPILLTVHAIRAHHSGHGFLNCGELLYLVKTLPPTFISGPPLRETPQPRKVSRPPPAAKEPEIPRMVGSFLLDPARDPDLMRRQQRKQKKDRERQISRERRRKRRRRT
jgi:putative RNA 2'-phosphotransferase